MAAAFSDSKVESQCSAGVRSPAGCLIVSLDECQEVCKKLLNMKACSCFEGLQMQLKKFNQIIAENKQLFSTKTLQSKESQFSDSLQTKSPFNTQHLTTWLEHKEEEIKVLEKYVVKMELENIKFVSKSDLQGEITDASLENSHVVCFSFNVTSSEDDCLKQMNDALYQSITAQTVSLTSWIKNEKKTSKLMNQVMLFISFVRANSKAKQIRFMMTECADESQSKDEPVIMLYTHQNLVSEKVFSSKEVGTIFDSVTDCSICVKQWKRVSENVNTYTVCLSSAKSNESEMSVDGAQVNNSKECTKCKIDVCRCTSYTLPKKRKPSLFSSLPSFVTVDCQCEQNQDETVPTVYSLPISVTHRVSGKMYRKVVIGKAPSQVQDIISVGEKVLMVVGATGAGKTTLINGMINYILGVRWEDDFRFKLISEQNNANQAQSQTQVITAYTIPRITHSLFQCPLTIIDTPGFGDTRGMDQDNKIVSSIEELFRDPKGIAHLDGIGFVTQSSLPRLTPTQKYIFNSVLKIFGNDVVDNIFVLATFSDTSKPPVISALKEDRFNYSNLFKFNNSALYAGKKDDIDETFWQLGKRSFSEFFMEFMETKSVSLRLTLDVLKERNKLSSSLEKLQRQVDVYLDCMVSKERHIKGSTAEDQTDLKTFHQLIDKVAQHMNKLVEIAVRPHPITPVEYIQLLISNEMDRKKRQNLEIAKKQAVMLPKLQRLSDVHLKIKNIKDKKPSNWEDSITELQHELKEIKDELLITQL